jgi:hypothetical protein
MLKIREGMMASGVSGDEERTPPLMVIPGFLRGKNFFYQI